MIIIIRRRTMMITIVSLRELHGRNSQLLPQCFRAASAQLPRTLGAMTDDDDDDDNDNGNNHYYNNDDDDDDDGDDNDDGGGDGDGDGDGDVTN